MHKKVFTLNIPLLAIAVLLNNPTQSQELPKFQWKMADEVNVLIRRDTATKTPDAIKRILGGHRVEDIYKMDGWTLMTLNDTSKLSKLKRKNLAGVMTFKGDRTTIFSEILTEDQLSDSESAEFGKVKLLNGQKVSLMKAVPSAVLQHAFQEGYGREKNFDKAGSFNLPISSDSGVKVSKLSFSENNNSAVWRGGIEGANAEVYFVKTGDKISGYVKSKSVIYRYISIGKDVYAVVELRNSFPDDHYQKNKGMNDSSRTNNNKDVDDSLPVIDSTRNNNDYVNLQLDRLADNESVEINIMVGYTAAVTQSNSHIYENLINPAVQILNQNLKDSGIDSIKFKLVHFEEVSYQESFEWDDHLKYLTTKGDGVMDGLHVSRDIYKADLVVLLIDDRSACGQAGNILANEDKAFAVVHFGCVMGNFSFSHEVAHLFGCRHDRCVDPNQMPFSFGHGYYDPDLKWRTIMSYRDCCDCNRIGQFSNPAKTFGDKPTGSAAFENNKEVFLRTAKTISRFRN